MTTPFYRRVNSYDRSARTPKLGSVWVWELDKPHARCLVVVREVIWNGEEWWVTTDTLMEDVQSIVQASEALNDLGRFYEACVPVVDTHMAFVAVTRHGGDGDHAV